MNISFLYFQTINYFIVDTCVHSSMKECARRHCLYISKMNNASFPDSIAALKKVCKRILKTHPSFGNSMIALEATISCIDGSSPLTADVMIFGCGPQGMPGIFILEMKEWDANFASLPIDSDKIRAGLIQTRYHDNNEDSGIRKHPSRQASDYRFHPSFFSYQHDVNIKAAAYCFRCRKGSETFSALYYCGGHKDEFDIGYDDYLKDCRTYTAETIDKLCNSIIYNVGYGSPTKVFQILSKI